MKNPKEKEIQAFWTKYPMIHPGYGFEPQKATPEEVFAHVERLMRDKGGLFQSEGAPLLSRFIDYPSLQGKKALDIGYGVGWLVNELAKAGADTYGIDLSESHHAFSSHRFEGMPNVHLQVASAEDIPFPDETFDFVSAYGVLHHAEHDQRCYDEVWRVLKPGGSVYFMLYRKGGPKYWWRKLFFKGILKLGLVKHNFNVAEFINSVTDVHYDDSPGAPISRHYTRADLRRLFSKFSEMKAVISGNRGEWDNLPHARLPLSNVLSPRMRDKLVETSGAYWMVMLKK